MLWAGNQLRSTCGSLASSVIAPNTPSVNNLGFKPHDTFKLIETKNLYFEIMIGHYISRQKICDHLLKKDSKEL